MLHRLAAPYVPDIRDMWDMTANELIAAVNAGRKREEKAARETELLAFNIGALVLAAFNAPGKFPRTPDEAFGRMSKCGTKEDMLLIAKQLNARMKEKGVIG